MRCNYGNLKRGEVYECWWWGCDWYQINGIYVHDALVERLEHDPEPLWDYDKERWDNLPKSQDDEYESYAQYITREMPPVASW